MAYKSHHTTKKLQCPAIRVRFRFSIVHLWKWCDCGRKSEGKRVLSKIPQCRKVGGRRSEGNVGRIGCCLCRKGHDILTISSEFSCRILCVTSHLHCIVDLHESRGLSRLKKVDTKRYHILYALLVKILDDAASISTTINVGRKVGRMSEGTISIFPSGAPMGHAGHFRILLHIFCQPRVSEGY